MQSVQLALSVSLFPNDINGTGLSLLLFFSFAGSAAFQGEKCFVRMVGKYSSYR